jgi:hypothetical protein
VQLELSMDPPVERSKRAAQDDAGCAARDDEEGAAHGATGVLGHPGHGQEKVGGWAVGHERLYARHQELLAVAHGDSTQGLTGIGEGKGGGSLTS